MGVKRLILYDLDGTLVDTRKDIVQATNHMRTQMGLAPLGDSEICRCVGLGLRQLVQSCLMTEDPGQTEEGMRVYRAYYTQHLLDHTVLYPGVREALEFFRPRSQAVVTNKPNPYSRQILEALGVAGYFFEIIAGDSEFAKKPDPEALLAIMQRQGTPARETVFVGDSPIDVETGARAGVFTVGVTHGFSDEAELKSAGPDHIVNGFGELLEFARREGW